MCQCTSKIGYGVNFDVTSSTSVFSFASDLGIMIPGPEDTWLFVINTQTPAQSEFRLIGNGFGPREIDFSFRTGGKDVLKGIPCN